MTERKYEKARIIGARALQISLFSLTRTFQRNHNFLRQGVAEGSDFGRFG